MHPFLPPNTVTSPHHSSHGQSVLKSIAKGSDTPYASKVFTSSLAQTNLSPVLSWACHIAGQGGKQAGVGTYGKAPSKRGERSTKPEKVFILQGGLSLSLPLDGKHFQSPRQHRALWLTALESAKA